MPPFFVCIGRESISVAGGHNECCLLSIFARVAIEARQKMRQRRLLRLLLVLPIASEILGGRLLLLLWWFLYAGSVQHDIYISHVCFCGYIQWQYLVSVCVHPNVY